MNGPRREGGEPWHGGFVTWRALIGAIVGLVGVVAVDRLQIEKRIANLETLRDESSKTHDDLKDENQALRDSVDAKFTHIQQQLANLLSAFEKHEIRQQVLDEIYSSNKPGVRIPVVK